MIDERSTDLCSRGGRPGMAPLTAPETPHPARRPEAAARVGRTVPRSTPRASSMARTLVSLTSWNLVALGRTLGGRGTVAGEAQKS